MVEQFPTFRYYYLNQGEGLAGGIQSGVLDDGEVLIGKGNNPAVAANLTAGAGVTIENNPGQVVIHASARGAEVGDVKYGFQNEDHSGWVRLDGRGVATLSSSQQTAATSIGFVSNLPDLTDKYVSSRGGVGLGEVVGQDSVTLARSDLPNITLGGTTNQTGNHTHQVYFNNYGVTSGGNGVLSVGNGGGVNVGSYASSPSGQHSHTFTTESLNGAVSQTSINLSPLTVNINSFIYLGD